MLSCFFFPYIYAEVYSLTEDCLGIVCLFVCLIFRKKYTLKRDERK